jgi:hypothetical protein
MVEALMKVSIYTSQVTRSTIDDAPLWSPHFEKAQNRGTKRANGVLRDGRNSPEKEAGTSFGRRKKRPGPAGIAPSLYGRVAPINKPGESLI